MWGQLGGNTDMGSVERDEGMGIHVTHRSSVLFILRLKKYQELTG